MKNPKFSVGELARYVDSHEQYPGIMSRVIDRQYIKSDALQYIDGSGFASYAGWRYKTVANSGVDAWTFEYSLRPIPKEQKGKWKDCAWQPDKVAV